MEQEAPGGGVFYSRSWSRKLQEVEQYTLRVEAEGSSLWSKSLHDFEQEAFGSVVQRSCSAQGALKFIKGKRIFLTAIR